MEDRRTHARRPLVIEARFQDQQGTILKGRVRNLGMGGAYIDTLSPLDPCSVVKLTLDVVDTGKIVDALGRVVRVFPGRGMAVEFCDEHNLGMRVVIDMLARIKSANSQVQVGRHQTSAAPGLLARANGAA